MDQFSLKTKFTKFDEDLGLAFGYAIICKEDGEPYYDLQGDYIPEDVMLKSAKDFMLNSRSVKEMHRGDDVGSVAFCFPMTGDIAKSLGIETKVTGLLIGVHAGEDVGQKFKDGSYSGFSIGGYLTRELADAA